MTYLEFIESQGEFISIKGKDGDVLNTILTWAENEGDCEVTTRHLEQLEKMVLKIWEYDRAVHATFTNWMEGDAKRLMRYEVNGGVDAWRKPYIEYIPLAQMRQDTILTKILNLKLVSAKNVRKLPNGMQELRYKCIQCGGTPLGENIIKRMLVKCVPKEIAKPLSMHLGGSTTFQQVRKLIMQQMHDER